MSIRDCKHTEELDILIIHTRFCDKMPAVYEKDVTLDTMMLLRWSIVLSWHNAQAKQGYLQDMCSVAIFAQVATSIQTGITAVRLRVPFRMSHTIHVASFAQKHRTEYRASLTNDTTTLCPT